MSTKRQSFALHFGWCELQLVIVHAIVNYSLQANLYT